tara:strand:- start:14194 stop:14394 length:201 start_codon:yes stop_codon:yes gene_type:complete
MLRRKHLRNVAKLATKVSPIPIPDIVKDQISGATDKIEELSNKIDKIQESLDVIIEIFTIEDDEES